MKPITEHPEFRDAKKENCAIVSGHDDYTDFTTTDINSSFTAGGLTAQSILQKEHEGEMERFAEWLDLTYTNTEGGWSNLYETDPNQPFYTFQELLQLFREREGK